MPVNCQPAYAMYGGCTEAGNPLGSTRPSIASALRTTFAFTGGRGDAQQNVQR